MASPLRNEIQDKASISLELNVVSYQAINQIINKNFKALRKPIIATVIECLSPLNNLSGLESFTPQPNDVLIDLEKDFSDPSALNNLSDLLRFLTESKRIVINLTPLSMVSSEKEFLEYIKALCETNYISGDKALEDISEAVSDRIKQIHSQNNSANSIPEEYREHLEGKRKYKHRVHSEQYSTVIDFVKAEYADQIGTPIWTQHFLRCFDKNLLINYLLPYLREQGIDPNSFIPSKIQKQKRNITADKVFKGELSLEELSEQERKLALGALNSRVQRRK